MKKLKIASLILLFIGFSCKKNEVLQINSNNQSRNTEKIVNFEGLNVVLPNDILESELHLTKKDYEIKLTSITSKSRILQSDVLDFPWEEYKVECKFFIDEIPNLWTLKDNNKSLIKLKKDFQGISDTDIEGLIKF
jgi:hypothetical protein